MKRIWLFVFSLLLLTACGVQTAEPVAEVFDADIITRHNTDVPDVYKGITNPIPADADSLARGKELYTTNCASCHGDGGLGDGPVSSSLLQKPSPIARTSQVVEDDYLFWRISEGGVPFGTAMPAWQMLSEHDRWSLIHYIQMLTE